jgi:hypothetical protein
MTIKTFSGSIWHALWVLALPAAVVFGLAFRSVKKWSHFYFDPKHNRDVELKKEGGEFGPHMQRYQDLSKFAITLSAGATAFLINTLINQKPPIPAVTQRAIDCAPIVVGYFGITIATLIIFMLVQDLWYEEYCHSPKHNTYKAWKYATSYSLGFTGLVSFVLGFGWLALGLFY